MFPTEVVTTWMQAVQWSTQLGTDWAFRGQSDDWPLTTSLERTYSGNLGDYESRTLSRFRRTARSFLQPHMVPREDDVFAWMGLMQHYGGPTRLLDLTRSYWVALYFAFEAEGPQQRVVAAMNLKHFAAHCANQLTVYTPLSLESAQHRVDKEQYLVMQDFVAGGLAFAGVLPVEPYRPDQRQSAQQALFVTSCDLSRTLQQNVESSGPTLVSMMKLKFSPELRPEVLRRLREMNITAATLFPGLDGMARSLRTEFVEFPDAIDLHINA